MFVGCFSDKPLAQVNKMGKVRFNTLKQQAQAKRWF